MDQDLARESKRLREDGPIAGGSVTGPGASGAGAAEANQLVDDREIQSYGLLVNHRYHLIVCAQPECGYALMPTTMAISEHLGTHGRPVREFTVRGWLERHNIPATPRIPASPCVAVEGVAIKDGVVCAVPGCDYACTSERNLRSRHRTAAHAGLVDLPYRPAKVQLVYSTGEYRRHVEVLVPAGLGPDGDVCRIITAHDDRLARERTMLNLAGTVRETSQWLVRSGISAFAAPYTQAQLLAHAEMTVLPDSSSGWLGALCDAAARYFDECVNRLDEHADDVVLRHIRSRTTQPDQRAMSRIENTAKYRSIFTRFMAFVLRAEQGATEAPFALTEGQRDACTTVRSLCGGALPSDGMLCPAVHRLAFSLFAHDYEGRKPYSTPLVAFSFLVTLDRFHGYFLPPALVTPYTAALSYAARCVVYAEIQADASASGTTTFKSMPKYLHWVKVGEPHAFDALRQVHDTARNISMHAASPDRVFWSSGNKSSFRYLGHPIQMAAIRRMVAAMSARLDELEASLGRHADLTCAALTLPAILYDDPACLQPGYSFVSEDEKGIDPAEYTRQLLRSGHFCKLLPGTDVTMWLQRACVTWRDDYLEFSTLLAALMHMCAGQPPRGTEALQTLIVNADRRRSLVCTDETEMLWVLDYNKSSEITGGFDRTIIRGLDRHLGGVVKRNVAFMRKFAQLLAEEVFHCEPASVLHGYKFLNRGIFGRDVGTDEVSKTMQAYALEHVGLPLSVSDWRHIMTSMARHLISDIDVATTALQADLDYHEGHSSLTAQLHYGRERNGLTSQLISRFLPLSRCVHKILGRPLSVASDGVPIDEADAVEETSTGESSQQPRAAEVAREVVESLAPRLDALKLDEAAVASNIVVLMKSELREMAASMLAQYDAGIADGLKRHGYLPLYPGEPVRMAAQPAAVLDRRGRDLLFSLRALLQLPDAVFRSPAQRDALEAVVRHEGHTATFIPTAGGKTLIFQLVCAHFDRAPDVTIVYVPWVVLAESHLRSSLALGIPSCIWRRDAPVFQKLTFVIPETGSADDFHAGLRELAATSRLKRFFLDEVHSWVMDSTYRPAMLDASVLSKYAVPIHILSATVPVEVYHHALRQLGIASISAPKVFRERSVRSSIRYCVFELRESDFVAHITTAAARLLTRSEDRAIVFVRRVADGEDAARRLGCDVFHSGLVPEERSAVLRRWEQGERKVIVATTLLATGYHVPDVRLVIEYGASWNYITHSQGTGRGGRGDTYCEAHVLLDPTKSYTVPNPGEFGHGEMMACLRTDRACMREGMGRYLDGFGERCTDLPLSYVPCSRCTPIYQAPRSGDPIPLRAAPVRSNLAQAITPATDTPVCNLSLRIGAEMLLLDEGRRRETEEYLRVRLEMLRDVCRGCWLRTGTRRDDHATHLCLEEGNIVRTHIPTQHGDCAYSQLKQRFAVDKRLVCIWCWVPKTPNLHPHTSVHGSQCVYEDVIPQVCVGAWISHRQFLVMSPLFPLLTAATSFDEYWGWLAARGSDDYYPNFVHLFLCIADHVLAEM
ncbi:hypothetical protein AURDEDRAFT_172315 [Auricularia subglabra TFB-10046 SS5]|nr:hypothetical protein AURDEDRAFT_172315 [Auricularia subglabra TFB-10046 SS5]